MRSKRSHIDYSAQLMDVLRRRLKGAGITQEEAAKRLSVSLPTAKRWLAGKSVTLETVKRVCDLAGVNLAEVALELDQVGPVQAHYTDEQEEYLALHPDCLAFFDLLSRGRTIGQIQAGFKLDKKRVERFLSALEKISLIDWLPKNRARLRMTGEPVWKKDGPLAQRFKGEILDQFLSRQSTGYFSLNEFLPEDADRVQGKISDLLQTVRQANQRAKNMRGNPKSYGSFICIEPFRWHIDDYLRSARRS